MAVPYTFGSATTSIPLSQLDSNFATTITLGNTAIQLGNTVTTLNNMTLANVTISSGTSNLSSTSIANGTSNVTIASSGGNITLGTAGTTAVTIDTGQRSTFPTTIAIGGATPSTSGSGISFPATQSASSNANTLDDYEEGTFTPTLTSSSGSVTYGSQQGIYTKVGNTVTCTFWIQWTGSSLSGSTVLMNNLPFSQSYNSRPSPSIRANGFASATNVLGGWVPGGGTSIQIGYYASGGGGDVSGSQITGGGEYGGTVVYQTT